MPIDFSTDAGKVRLLLNDVDTTPVFTDPEITAFLDLEGGNVKRAAAQAIDTNADNEALAAKVLTSQTAADGAKLAVALHARAQDLRAQANVDEAGAGYFDIVEPGCGFPELSGW